MRLFSIQEGKAFARKNVSKSSKNAFFFAVVSNEESEKITEVGKSFSFHPLAFEMAFSKNKLSFFNEFDSHVFLSFHTFRYRGHQSEIEELDFALGKNFLVVIPDKHAGFEGIWKKLLSRAPLPKTPDRLLYAILDLVVDDYYREIEKIEEVIDQAEVDVLDHSGKKTLRDLFLLRQSVLAFRKMIQPQLSAVNSMIGSDTKWLLERNRFYFRDLFENLTHIEDLLETQRATLNNLTEAHQSLTSHEFNELIKVLTIITVVAVPFTVVSSIYGMNLDGLPLIHDPLAPFYLIGFMFVLVAIMLYVFFRKGWLR